MESNVYSELQQKDFSLQNKLNENLGSIFETNDEEEIGVVSENKVFSNDWAGNLLFLIIFKYPRV